MKWVFPATLLGIAGLVLALLKDRKLENFIGFPWLVQRENCKEKLHLVPGLQNLGNSCFLNVVLQALASCTYFQPCLLKVIEECESSASEECSESLQLTVALAALLEELCAFGEGRVVLSPRKVMLAMAQYIQDFNLTSQQDAEEAFLHLLSSLREEFSDCYPSNQSSLIDAFNSHSIRILTPKSVEIQNEKGRWQQHFLGPFDGILSSSLQCQSCSTQISWNFQFFHSLPLSPVLQSGATIMVGCTLEDCLKQFIVAERVENYNCSRCWHIAAVKYLSLSGEKETEIEKLRSCGQQDSCSCLNLFDLESLPWSNRFSCTLKQLRIARCPKILCIHLQRASINHFGEPIKLEGHIGFPLILNLLPFMLEELQYQKQSLHLNHIRSDSRMLHGVYGQNIHLEASSVSVDDIGHAEQIQVSDLPQTTDCLNNLCTVMSSQDDDKVKASCPGGPLESAQYHLVSVVEHFGRSGGGHYTIYRGVGSKLHKEHREENFKSSPMHWYCISDSEVHSVSEEDVLAAEASLLFYERILEI